MNERESVFLNINAICGAGKVWYEWSLFIMAKNERSISRIGVKSYEIHYMYKYNTCIKKPILASYHSIFIRKSKSYP